jgi:FAD synthetase
MKKVMVFGVFDGVHEGHRWFFREAKSYGDYLIAVLAQDHIVEHLKGHLPRINLAKRFEALKKEVSVDEAVAGDSKIGKWEIVKKHKPDVIALGYDQLRLKESLEAHLNEFGYRPEIKFMNAHEPAKYRSSILNKSEAQNLK